MNLDNYFDEKELMPDNRHQQAVSIPKVEPQQQSTENIVDSVIGAVADIAGGLGGIFSPSPASGEDYQDPYVYENDLKKRKKKEKAKHKERSL